MTADEPMSTPHSGGLREAVARYADRHPEASLRADLRAVLAAHPEPVPTPDSADDATVGEREGCGAVSLDEDWVPGVCEAHDHLCVTHARDEHECTCGARWDATPDADDTSPPADDANRAPVSGGLDEGEWDHVSLVAHGVSGVHSSANLKRAVERILAARDAAWVERLAAVEGEREAAEAERATARREAGEAGAKALRDAADSLARGGFRSAVTVLRARADALTSDDGSGA